MVAQILSSNSSFNGVSYNTKKTDKNLGELMKVANFGYLQDMPNLLPQEYKNYLLSHSAINTKVKDKQFHVAISCEGKEYDKHQLTKIADDYLKEMGYSQNPYLVVFHKDTKNNHVHIVTSRIGFDGKKIPDNMERRRSVSAIQKIMNNDIQQATKILIEKASKFNISSLPQFKLILEKAGYKIEANNQELLLRKFGNVQASIPLAQINNQIADSKKDIARVGQLRAVIEEYKQSFNSEIKPVFEYSKSGDIKKQIGYTSDLSEVLKSKFGLDIVFHGKDNLPPYGYSIIDNAKQSVFKGSEVMSLKELLSVVELKALEEINIKVDGFKEKEVVERLFPKQQANITMLEVPKERLNEINAILKSSINDYNTIEEGLKENKISVLVDGKDLFIYDKENDFLIDGRRVLNSDDYKTFAIHSGIPQQKENEPEKSTAINNSIPVEETIKDEAQGFDQSGGVLEALQSFDLNISSDTDDSKVHGKKRGKEKSKTKSR